MYIFSIHGFEFDPAKSAANMEKHGIDFRHARQLWLDPGRAQFPVGDGSEERFIVIGKIAATHWSAVITYRGDNIRIISVRRSRRNEIENYYG